ncbi:MAG: hypothetical protein ABIY47_08425 [Opitutaceae bacterium]
MKTNSSLPLRSIVLAGLALGAFTATALAGPGSEYWRNQGKPAPVGNPAAAAPAGKAVPCVDGRTVAVTETRIAQANGRGPLQTVQIGAKRVCGACAYPVVFMKPAQANGRGPLAPVVVAGTHDCVAGCMMVAAN